MKQYLQLKLPYLLKNSKQELHTENYTQIFPMKEN